MDVTTGVRSDVLPAVGSILLPGTVAATPWVALAWGEPHNLQALVQSNEGIATAAAVLLVIGVGLVVESVGTFVESHVVDRLHDDYDEIQKRWTEYLKIAWVREPVGQRYLRRVLTTFRFELNMMVAVVLGSTPGILALGYYNTMPERTVVQVILASLWFAAYLAYAVHEDSKLLHRLRGDLIEVAKSQTLPASIPAHE